MRSAPRSGYNDPRKGHWRRQVWAGMRRAFHGHLSDRHFALLPSTEGTEIDIAKAAGVREHNLHVIDREPAIVASIRKRYPKVTTYGVDTCRAIQRMAENGVRLSGFNLDLCGPLGRPTRDTLMCLAKSGVMLDQSVVAVTMLRGREQTTDRSWSGLDTIECLGAPDYSERLSARDRARVSRAAACIQGVDGKVNEWLSTDQMLRRPYSAVVTRTGTYRSSAGSQTMLWAMFELHERPCICDRCFVGDAHKLWPHFEVMSRHRLVRTWRELMNSAWGDERCRESEEVNSLNNRFGHDPILNNLVRQKYSLAN